MAARAAGSYMYRAWRPGGETTTGTVVGRAGRPVEIAWP